MNEQKRLLTKA